jgi:hypothetical protein
LTTWCVLETGLAAVARQQLNFTQLAVARAVAGVRQGGEKVAEIEIAPDGTIKIVTTTDAPAEPTPAEPGNKAKARAAFKEI